MSLGREQREFAHKHLADLASRQRTPPVELRVTRVPRLRQFGRRIWDVGSKLLDLVEIVGRFLINPRHVPGRWFARLRLFAPTKTFDLWLLGMTVFAIGLGLLTFVRIDRLPWLLSNPNWRKGAIVAVMGSLFTGTVLALLALLWNDLFRCPHLTHRICRQIRRRPDCVLLNDIGHRAIKLAPREEPVAIVPRTELYDEITPGALQRKRKDVQIVVGDPGAGKTTALIGIAGTLARLGIVPVLVPLRSSDKIDLLELGKERLRKQVHDYVRSDSQFEQLWRWLYQRRRVALLTDDLDRLSPDGERGFMLRKALKEVETVDLPIIVTARPAGLPAGIAASAIDLGGLDEARAIECVAKGARSDPSFRASREVSHQSLARWISAGQLTEVPYYLELLAQLAAAGADTFPELAEPWTSTIEIDQKGLFKSEPDGTATWNPWWVHFLLIDHFYREVCSGNVARWKGIEPRERQRAMEGLQHAALGVLLSQTVTAPKRSTIEDFVPTNDRDEPMSDRGERPTHRPDEPETEHGEDDGANRWRPGLSPHEVIDTAERLRILDRDADGKPQFRHRITQAYLAGRRLAEIEVKEEPLDQGASEDWRLRFLLDHRHPEKLTAQTALTFAALWADRAARNTKLREQREGQPMSPSAADWHGVGQRILQRLVAEAEQSLLRGADRTDDNPQVARDPENRRDPDDALIKLTTASDVALAIEHNQQGRHDGSPGIELLILDRVNETRFVTRWTKLNAIKAIAALEAPARWQRVWEFARDPDYAVRQAASIALERDACNAYQALETDIQKLLTRASALSAFGQSLEKPMEAFKPSEQDNRDGQWSSDNLLSLRALGEKLLTRASALSTLGQSPEKPMEAFKPSEQDNRDGQWSSDNLLSLRALGTVLPAIVSGLQEDPAAARALAAWHGRDKSDGYHRQPDSADERRPTPNERERLARSAREALDHLVALAYQGDHLILECMVAQGFRADAMRHAIGDAERGQALDRSHAGPGWVAAHERHVTTIGLCQAEHWYAQLVLGQALALYTIAGGSRQVGYDTLARCIHRGGPHSHPFTQQAMRLARTAVRRHSIHSKRWRAYIWDDETTGSNKRPVSLTNRTAQLLGDVTVLLDLSEGAREDRLEVAAHMDELPYCLHRSRDRSEILGAGCPPECGWNLCPYKQPPPDEPNEHHGVSRAFCRQQRWIARHHRPPWQRRIRRRHLTAFWHEMERRART